LFPYRINDRGDLLAFRDLRPHEPSGPQLFCRNGRCEPITIPLTDIHDVNAAGLDDQGDIVGSYRDETGSEHGYLLRNGGLITIDAPGARETVATGVNNRGWVVGFAHAVNGTSECHGFLATPRSQL
jgi:hypothetical protein